MSANSESKLAYVVRKLNDPAYNNNQMCRMTGITPAAAVEIAKGRTKNPRWETVEKIANYFQNLK